MKEVKIENVIYVLTNPQYPGYIKIGYASDLKQRLSSLNTGALVEFEPYAVYETTQKNADINIHKIIKLLNPILQASKFNEKNQAKQKEFFKIEPEEAFALLEQIAIVSGTRHKLYRLDKYLNKFDVKPKNPVANDDDNDKNGDTKNTPPPTPSATTSEPIQPPHPIPAGKNCIPDGIYTMKTKIKKLNKVVQGTMEVKNGEFVLKAGSDVAPENVRYH